MKIQAVSFVRLSDLQHAWQLKHPFSGPSYGSGDSAYVMCYPQALADELEAGPKHDQLIRELRSIPEGVLVGLDG